MNNIFDNERPIYLQIVEMITIDIVSGKYKKEEKIPSVRELAMKLKVNPNTMQKALSELEDKKLIYTERTNGKYVTGDKDLINKVKSEIAMNKTKKYIQDMTSLGINSDETIKYIEKLGGKYGTN